jgi:hypothetical protein
VLRVLLGVAQQRPGDRVVPVHGEHLVLGPGRHAPQPGLPPVEYAEDQAGADEEAGGLPGGRDGVQVGPPGLDLVEQQIVLAATSTASTATDFCRCGPSPSPWPS